jgi:cardiolipin synthase (CMP-forming)
MDLFNLPNSLTLMRIFAVPVFTYFFLTQQYRIALIIFVFTGLTDIIDGTLARLLNKKTTLGAILDPAADKLLMFVTFIVLSIRHLIPVWLTFLVIFRDVWIVSGILVLKQLKRKLYFKPTRLSKLTTFFQLLTIFLSFLLTFLLSEKPESLMRYQGILQQALGICIYFAAGMTLASGIQYTRIGLMILKGSREYADLPLKKAQTRRE